MLRPYLLHRSGISMNEVDPLLAIPAMPMTRSKGCTACGPSHWQEPSQSRRPWPHNQQASRLSGAFKRPSMLSKLCKDTHKYLPYMLLFTRQLPVMQGPCSTPPLDRGKEDLHEHGLR